MACFMYHTKSCSRGMLTLSSRALREVFVIDDSGVVHANVRKFKYWSVTACGCFIWGSTSDM
eukprot:6059284-Ditylum_brightwellii.AAC.1